MKRNQILTIVLVILVLFFFIDPIYAGPGGAIAKGLFKTWWGKILLIGLTVILLPLIIYVKFREFFAVKNAKKELLKVGKINKDFSWLNLDKNVRNIFSRVYVAWGHEDMKEVSSYVSHWYWQNQQQVYLDEWKRNNLRNICKLDGIRNVKPLYLEITENDNQEGSRIAFCIEANISDYLINKTSGKIVKGRRGYQEEEKIWIMEYTDGKWLLDDIQEGQLSLAFAKMKNSIPESLSFPNRELAAK